MNSVVFGLTVSQSSRILPQKPWAGAVPTLLSHEALDLLCTPSPHPNPQMPGPELCPLERFLGCVSLKRYLQRSLQGDDPMVSIFKLVILNKSNIFVNY